MINVEMFVGFPVSDVLQIRLNEVDPHCMRFLLVEIRLI